MDQQLVDFLGMQMHVETLTVKPLNWAAFIYLAACFSYFITVARSGLRIQSVWNKISANLVRIAFVLHTLGLLGRWYVGGFDRPPWTNLYESLVGFAWMLSLFQVISLQRWKVPLLGAFSVPLIFLLMGMSVMTPNKAVEPLIPALQSHWIKIHVVFGMISYAGFTMSACFAFLHLIKSKASLSKVGAGLCLIMLINLGIAGGTEIFQTGHFYMAKTVLRKMPDGTEKYVKDVTREYEGGPMITRMEEVPHAHWFFYLSSGAFLVSAILMLAQRKKTKTAGLDISKGAQNAFIVAVAGLVGLFGAIWYGVHHSATLTLGSNPYLVMLLFMSFFEAIVFIVIFKRYNAFLSALPTADRLDELSYKNILFSFPFQTLLLITGAIWAYYAWGRSWGWDPKETWALITWIAFLIYLHGKLLLNWKSHYLAINALIGFVILVFAFLGVNLVLSGLHSYGAA